MDRGAGWQGTLSHKPFTSETVDLEILESDDTVLNFENNEERALEEYSIGVERRVRKQIKIL
jgi:hypothetical protein